MHPNRNRHVRRDMYGRPLINYRFELLWKRWNFSQVEGRTERLPEARFTPPWR